MAYRKEFRRMKNVPGKVEDRIILTAILMALCVMGAIPLFLMALIFEMFRKKKAM